jgi:hypothetical protein
VIISYDGIFTSETPVPMKQEQICLIRVKLCNALLRMLVICIRSYLKAALKYKFLILDTYHPDIEYLLEQICENPWLFFEAKEGPPVEKCMGNIDWSEG